MSVIRVHKSKNYTVMSNTHLRDKKLSLKAKGLLSVMLSLPDNWDYSIAGLVAISKENETAVKSALNELKDNNYVVVTKENPTKSNGGRIKYTYEVYEEPHKQRVDGQGLENLGVENKTVREVVKNAFHRYMNLYETYFCKVHPILTDRTLTNVCLSLSNVTDTEHNHFEWTDVYLVDETGLTGLDRMVNEHFRRTHRRETNYSITHFAKSDYLLQLAQGIIEY